MYAQPMPVDPYSPLPPNQQEDSIRHPSPYVPIRLPVFAIVMWLNDMIVKVISTGGGGPSRKGTGRNEMTETMEEGGGVGGTPLRPIRNRVNIARRAD
jgi:etoposide-induced 2.4 mRNA